MAAREYLYLVQETSLLVPNAAPVLGTSATYIRLIDSNAFTGYAKRIIEYIPSGGGVAIASEAVSDHYEAKGQIKTKLYGSQAAFLLGWALTRINVGQTQPWTTTEPAGDLASVAIYHAYRNSNGTYRNKVYLGCKPTGVRIEVSRQSTSAMLTIDFQACMVQGHSLDGTSDPSITAPTENQYPVHPYTFKMTAGGLTLGSGGGTVRAGYDDLTIAVQNVVDGRWFETSYLQVNQFCGRQSTLDTTLFLKATPDDRSAYDALTAQSCSVTFTNGVSGQNLTISYNGNNVIDDLPFDLPIDKVYMQKLTLRNMMDSSVPGDLAISFT